MNEYKHVASPSAGKKALGRSNPNLLCIPEEHSPTWNLGNGPGSGFTLPGTRSGPVRSRSFEPGLNGACLGRLAEQPSGPPRSSGSFYRYYVISQLHNNHI